MKIFVLVSCLLIALNSCENKDQKKSNVITTSANKDTTLEENATGEISEGLSVRYLGLYSGTQQSYFLRNANGEEIEIRGEKVEVPACDYKFIIKLNKLVSLQQINLSNNQRIIYEGTYQVVDENDQSISISCSVSDGSGSSPNYTLQIDKATKSAVCFSNSEPEFTLVYGAEKKDNYAPAASKQGNKDSANHQPPVEAGQDSASIF